MQYAGMAFQFGILLALGAYVGQKLDAHFGLAKPYLTALSVIVFLFLALYLVLKDLLRK